MGDLTLFEALTGGAFDRLNRQYSGEFDQNISKKSNAPGFARGCRGWAVLELTGRLPVSSRRLWLPILSSSLWEFLMNIFVLNLGEQKGHNSIRWSDNKVIYLSAQAMCSSDWKTEFTPPCSQVKSV